MYDKLIEFISHWFENVTPARKVADVAVAFLIAFMAGSLLLAYNAESDIRRLAIKALDKTPELDTELVKKLAVPLFSDVQKAGGIALAVFHVDLASNTTRLIVYNGPETLKSVFPRLKAGFDKSEWISGAMSPAQLEIAASLMNGVGEVTYYPSADVTLVAIPIPDQKGSFLCGFVMAAIPGKVAEDAPVLANVRLLLSEFSHAVL